MTACAYCERSKAKRSCPALGASICPACCGRHRLQEIACPADCRYLGGLAVVRGPANTFTKADYHAVRDKLFAYPERELRAAAVAHLFDTGAEPAEWELGLASGYIHYGHRDPDGRRLIDRFLAARGRDLPPGEATALLALQRSRASLFEVQVVNLGVGLELRDLLSNETVSVREVSATAQLKKWDVIFSWLIEFPDHLELTGAVAMIPRPHVDRVHRALIAQLAGPDVGSIAWVVLHELRAAIADRRMPTLKTTDGENIVLCKAHFAIHDPARARQHLAAIPDLNEDDHDTFSWVDHARKLALGCIRLTGDALVLETMSRERNEAGKRMLAAALGTAATYRIDSIQDVESAIRDLPARTNDDDSRPDTDIEREILGEQLREHYRTWPDVPLPALNNKTPRKAARTRRGRAQVEALLKDIENGSLGMPGGDTVDFAALRRELGIAPADPADPADDADDLSYDANCAPDPSRWLATDESLRSSAVERYHRSLRSHPPTPNHRLHALFHVIVENQLAGGDPPEVRATVDRLAAAGLTRHEAIHAVASVVAEQLFAVTRSTKPIDAATTARSLASLDPRSWRFAP